MLTQKEAYEVLGVPYLCDFQICKRAYHELCKQIHPDNTSGTQKQEQTKRMLLVNEAYALLQKLDTVRPSEISGNSIKTVARESKIFGNPAAAVERTKINRTNAVRKSALEKQKTEEKLQKKNQEILQKQKEDKILEQIRWIRLTDIIRKTMEEDAHKEELSKKAQEEIRKAGRQ